MTSSFVHFDSLVTSFLYSTSQFPHLTKLPDCYSDIPPNATMEECCLWLESVPYFKDWERLHEYSDCDLEFEADLLDCFFQVIAERDGREGTEGGD